MKFTIERAVLLPALAHVQSVVEARNTIPILSNVLLTADGDKLTMSATDMDIEISESVAAAITAPGTITVSARTLYDVIRKFKDGDIEFSLDTGLGVLTVSAGRSRFKLGCIAAVDFPHMKTDDLTVSFAVDAPAFLSLLTRAKFAVSTEEVRYYLNGIYLHTAIAYGETVLRGAATDGHRLARVDMPLPDGAGGMPGVIFPRKAIAEVCKLLADVEGPITVALSAAKIMLTIGDVILTSKLIDGSFPDYERVIPTGNDKSLEFDSAEMTDVVGRIATINTEKTRTIKMSVAQGAITISSKDSYAGAGTEDMDAAYSGQPMDIGFNSRYLLDTMAQIDVERCSMQFSDGSAPILFSGAGDKTALYVLMPMRVS